MDDLPARSTAARSRWPARSSGARPRPSPRSSGPAGSTSAARWACSATSSRSSPASIGQLEGRLDLDLELKGHGPSLDDLRDSLAGRGTLRVDPIRLDGSSLLVDLARVLPVTDYGRVGSLRTDFTVQQRQVISRELTVRVGGTPIVLNGGAGFDGWIDYRVDCSPFAGQLGPEGFAVLAELGLQPDDLLDLRVRGTIAEPPAPRRRPGDRLRDEDADLLRGARPPDPRPVPPLATAAPPPAPGPLPSRSSPARRPRRLASGPSGNNFVWDSRPRLSSVATAGGGCPTRGPKLRSRSWTPRLASPRVADRDDPGVALAGAGTSGRVGQADDRPPQHQAAGHQRPQGHHQRVEAGRERAEPQRDDDTDRRQGQADPQVQAAAAAAAEHVAEVARQQAERDEVRHQQRGQRRPERRRGLGVAEHRGDRQQLGQAQHEGRVDEVGPEPAGVPPARLRSSC